MIPMFLVATARATRVISHPFDGNMEVTSQVTFANLSECGQLVSREDRDDPMGNAPADSTPRRRAP